MSMGHPRILSGESQTPLVSQAVFPTSSCAPPSLCGQRLVGLVGHHSSVPGEPSGTLWDVGQQTDVGMDANLPLCLSFPPAVVPSLLPQLGVGDD